MFLRSTLSRNEKLNYIDAVKCLHEKPALTPSAVAAGAKSRFDDFVVTHVIQTYWVHGTVSSKLLFRMRCSSLTRFRPTSLLGTVGTSGPTSSSCVTSVATRATSHTTVTPGGTRTPPNRPYLTAPTHQSPAKVHQAARIRLSQAFRSTRVL